MSKFKSVITLKQHTPLIHFQGDQAGATLRASEVKPKLDRFIIQSMSKEQLRNWVKKTPDKSRQFIKGYKLRFFGSEGAKIGQKWPMFFGGIGKKNLATNRKIILSDKPVLMEIFSLDTELRNFILEHICRFFAVHNFGMRQTKGFGSFYPERNSKAPQQWYRSYRESIDESYLNFRMNGEDLEDIFKNLEYFYKLLRSGINEQGSYCKPVIYFYVASRYGDHHWDKKTIKSHFFGNKFDTKTKVEKARYTIVGHNLQKNGFGNEGTSAQDDSRSLKKELLFRDLFGFSSFQKWDEGFSITKRSIEKKGKAIDRMASPLVFKLFEVEEGFDVFIIPNIYRTKEEYIHGHKFKVNVNKKYISKDDHKILNKNAIRLKFPSSFDWNDFFNFLRDEFILNQVFSIKKEEDKSHVFSPLNNIINQIRTD